MYKYLKYISLFICLFFITNLNVNAKSYYSGDCIYNIKYKTKYYNVKINRSLDGKMNYYVNMGTSAVKTVDDSGWKKNGTGDNISISPKFKTYNECPAYASIKFKKTDSKVHFYFGESPKKGKNIKASAHVNSSPSITKSSQGEKCSKTKVDWLQAPPKNAKKGDLYCLYSGEDKKGCYVVQVNYNNSTKKVDVYENFSNWKWGWTNAKLPVNRDASFDKDVVNMGCSNTIGLLIDTGSDETVTIKSALLSTAVLKAARGASSIALTKVKSEPSATDASIIKSEDIVKINSCEELLPSELTEMFSNLLMFVRVLVPMLLIVFGIIDFGTAVFAGDEEKMKKSQEKFIKRLIIGAVIFLIPSIIKIFLSLAHKIWPVIDDSLCGILK